jgi:hypothetical protein
MIASTSLLIVGGDLRERVLELLAALVDEDGARRPLGVDRDDLVGRAAAREAAEGAAEGVGVGGPGSVGDGAHASPSTTSGRVAHVGVRLRPSPSRHGPARPGRQEVGSVRSLGSPRGS